MNKSLNKFFIISVIGFLILQLLEIFLNRDISSQINGMILKGHSDLSDADAYLQLHNAYSYYRQIINLFNSSLAMFIIILSSFLLNKKEHSIANVICIITLIGFAAYSFINISDMQIEIEDWVKKFYINNRFFIIFICLQAMFFISALIYFILQFVKSLRTIDDQKFYLFNKKLLISLVLIILLIVATIFIKKELNKLYDIINNIHDIDQITDGNLIETSNNLSHLRQLFKIPNMILLSAIFIFSFIKEHRWYHNIPGLISILSFFGIAILIDTYKLINVSLKYGLYALFPLMIIISVIVYLIYKYKVQLYD